MLPSSVSLGRASWRKPWERGCPCVHLQNLTLHPSVSYRLWNQCPNEGTREAQIILKLGLEGLGGVRFQICYFWTEEYNFHIIFFFFGGGGGGSKVLIHQTFLKTPTPMGRNKWSVPWPPRFLHAEFSCITSGSLFLRFSVQPLSYNRKKKGA